MVVLTIMIIINFLMNKKQQNIAFLAFSILLLLLRLLCPNLGRGGLQHPFSHRLNSPRRPIQSARYPGRNPGANPKCSWPDNRDNGRSPASVIAACCFGENVRDFTRLRESIPLSPPWRYSFVTLDRVMAGRGEDA